MASMSAATDEDIYNEIFDAILAQKLQPGARLGEEDLARLFGVSRTKVRHALAKLTQDWVVQSRRNHGATVAAPTRAESRQVIALRLMIEPAMVRDLAGSVTEVGVLALRRHVASEHEARQAGDTAALIRLTGAFHLLLAELHGNPLVVRILREAEALLCLSILSYGRPGGSSCLPDEHANLIEALAAGQGETASALMTHHLHHVADGMDLGDRPI